MSNQLQDIECSSIDSIIIVLYDVQDRDSIVYG